MNKDELKELLEMLGHRLAVVVAPEMELWIDKADEVWEEGITSIKPQLTEIHEEIKELVGNDHLVVFGAVMAKTRQASPLSVLLREYENAGLNLLRGINDFLGDKKENDTLRMRTVRSITDPQGPALIGPDHDTPSALQLEGEQPPAGDSGTVGEGANQG